MARLSPAVVLLLACSCGVPSPPAAAQSPPVAGSGPAHVSEQAGADDDEVETPAPFEGEFIASTLFQGAMASLRLRSPLVLDAHYFGVEHNDVGVIGLAWTIARGELRVIPGLGWAFSRATRPAPVATIRWSYDGRRWLTQGLWAQSLRAYLPDGYDADDTEMHAAKSSARHAGIFDGIHASLVLGHAEVGPLVEYIKYRDEDEWKGGARVAWRLGGGFKLVSQLVGPGIELRGGLTWEP